MCDFRIIEEDWSKDKERCVCKPAVFNAYEGMLESGASSKKALEAALKVYRFYHPKDAKEASRLTVEQWLVAQSGCLH